MPLKWRVRRPRPLSLVVGSSTVYLALALLGDTVTSSVKNSIEMRIPVRLNIANAELVVSGRLKAPLRSPAFADALAMKRCQTFFRSDAGAWSKDLRLSGRPE